MKDIHTATHPGRVITGLIPTDHGDHDSLLAALDCEAVEEGNDAG